MSQEVECHPTPVRKTLSSQRHVLLVEDLYGNILVATTMLDLINCSYEVANTGKEALEKIKQGHFDLILMDVQMPEMDGLTATRLLRKWESKNGKPHLPVIAMTAHTHESAKEACFKAGMDDFISKPVYRKEFNQKLEFWSKKELQPVQH